MAIEQSSQFPAATLFSRCFNDVDELVEHISTYRQCQIDLLSLEPFQINIYQADLGSLLLFFADIASPVHFIGDRRSGFIQFDMSLELGVQPTFDHGQLIDQHALCSFDMNRGADTIFPAASLISDIHIRQDLFEATCQSMRRHDLLETDFLRRDCIHLPKMLNVYRNYLREVFHLVKTHSSLLQTPEYRQIILGDLLPILIDSIPQQTVTASLPPKPVRRAQLVTRARDFIQAHIHRPLTLIEIYSALGVSKRTLYYSFEDVLGLTPMEYLKIQRLQGARHTLKQADPKTTKVATVAQQWGFWCSGHFARDYQTMFGEFPTETLQRGC